eukprot:1157830-Pelagomonas_calceolata.AAC.1
MREVRMPRAEVQCVPFTKRRKKEVGVSQNAYLLCPLPDLVMRVERSLLKSVSGALDRKSMKLQSKLGAFVSVRTKLFIVWGI